MRIGTPWSSLVLHCYELLWEMWSRWSVRAEWGQGRLIHKYTTQKHVTRWEVAHWTPWSWEIGITWSGVRRKSEYNFRGFSRRGARGPQREGERPRRWHTHTHTPHRSHTPNELRTKCRIKWAGRLWSCCGRVATGKPWATASPRPVVPGRTRPRSGTEGASKWSNSHAQLVTHT